MDALAEIAQIKVIPRKEICTPQPQKFTEKKVALKRGGEKVVYAEKINDKSALYELLKAERVKYAPFMQDFAPKLEPLKQKTYLTDFVLDGKEKIKIPHYGGPTGYAKKTYETQFVMDEIRADKSYNVCFKGVDYLATVYVNGCCVGRHEGFFAPFSFDISAVLKQGVNDLKIEVENDYTYKGNNENGRTGHGDKLYAATGLGWDDPELGWHHCPAGMGIYDKVWIQTENRVYINDIFARPMVERGCVELWVEVYNSDYTRSYPSFNVSVYGQNFKATVVENKRFEAYTKEFKSHETITKDVFADKTGRLTTEVGTIEDELPMLKGANIYRILIEIPDAKLWSLETPYLYQAQVEVILDGVVCDREKQHFGMRSFFQDVESEKKGMFYLNGKKIRLRGANTMGFEQWDVLRGDFEQLIDDILLAKLCNMNFLRLTQRPVQDEIYEYCDKLGLMTQTDLPLFGAMRRTKFAEGVRQAEEMERLIRNHPCNVVVSFINEPFAYGKWEPHRHLLRDELERFFRSCEDIIKINNPERVLKYVDGDYDPPNDSMPDSHCYNLWYNGHTVDVGRMMKGYWCEVKPNWYYGCGEFGAEGLDFPEIMREYYPKEWLVEPFDPKNIVGAQTGGFYQFFYPRPKTLEEWVTASHVHQSNCVKIMTEAFRRNNDMATFAIHLYIDAWPSGWMKTIMDFKRNPKPAYFTYRNALEPLMISLRTDRFAFYSDEEIKLESYLSNDTNDTDTYDVVYEVTNEKGELLYTATTSAVSAPMETVYVGSPVFFMKDVKDRQRLTLTAFLLKDGKVVTYNQETIDVFERTSPIENNEEVVWITNLEPGEYEIAGEKVTVQNVRMDKLHFVAMSDGHEINDYFQPFDFRYWYDKKVDYITPLAEKCFTASGFKPVLLASSAFWGSKELAVQHLAAAEKVYEGKRYVICTLDLRTENPVARRFIDFMNRKVEQ